MKKVNKKSQKNQENKLLLQNIHLTQLNEVYMNKINDLTQNKKDKHIESK